MRLLVFDICSIYFYTNRIIMCHVIERTKSNTKGNLFPVKCIFNNIDHVIVSLVYCHDYMFLNSSWFSFTFPRKLLVL